MKSDGLIFRTKPRYLYLVEYSGSRIVLTFGDKSIKKKAGTKYSESIQGKSLRISVGRKESCESPLPLLQKFPKTVEHEPSRILCNQTVSTILTAAGTRLPSGRSIDDEANVYSQRAMIKYGLNPEEANKYQDFLRLALSFDQCITLLYYIATLITFLQETLKVGKELNASSNEG